MLSYQADGICRRASWCAGSRGIDSYGVLTWGLLGEGQNGATRAALSASIAKQAGPPAATPAISLCLSFIRAKFHLSRTIDNCLVELRLSTPSQGFSDTLFVGFGCFRTKENLFQSLASVIAGSLLACRFSEFH